MTVRDRLPTFLFLSVAVYLGFYVFGLVMGVYSPGEVWYFSIPAVGMAAFLVVAIYRERRARRAPAADPVTQAAHRLRETRGF
jgi:hypothetical protein